MSKPSNISHDNLVKKLTMLVKLCEETEPTPKQLLKMSGEKNADMTDLFTPEMIDAKFYLQEVLMVMMSTILVTELLTTLEEWSS